MAKLPDPNIDANITVISTTGVNQDTAVGATQALDVVGAVRDDALATITPAEGDAAVLRVDSTGALWVHLGTNPTVVNASDIAIDSAIGGTASTTLISAMRDDALSALTPVEGDACPLRVDANGALWVNLASGASISIGYQINIDSAIGATNATGLISAMRDDALSTLTPVEGDAVCLRTDSTGALWVNSVGTPSYQIAIDTAVGATNATALISAMRDDALSTLTPVEGDAVPLRTDSLGALWVNSGSFNAPLSTQTPVMASDTVTNSSATRTVYTVTSGKTLYLTGVLLSCDIGNAIATVKVMNNAATVILQRQFGNAVGNASANAADLAMYIPLPYVKFTSTQIVQWSGVATVNVTSSITIMGWEE